MSRSDIAAVCFPYCLNRQPDGSYVALNREYKPLGFTSQKQERYRDYPIQYRFKRFGPSVAARLSCRVSSDMERIYLYDDGCNPTGGGGAYWEAYATRLAILSRLKLKYE